MKSLSISRALRAKSSNFDVLLLSQRPISPNVFHGKFWREPADTQTGAKTRHPLHTSHYSSYHICSNGHRAPLTSAALSKCPSHVLTTLPRYSGECESHVFMHLSASKLPLLKCLLWTVFHIFLFLDSSSGIKGLFLFKSVSSADKNKISACPSLQYGSIPISAADTHYLYALSSDVFTETGENMESVIENFV